MKFIEMSGKTLLKIVNPDEFEGLRSAGVTEHSLVHINPQGDLEVAKRPSGGLSVACWVTMKLALKRRPVAGVGGINWSLTYKRR